MRFCFLMGAPVAKVCSVCENSLYSEDVYILFPPCRGQVLKIAHTQMSLLKEMQRVGNVHTNTRNAVPFS